MADAPERPGLTSKVKATALKELLTSVSLENKKQAGADMNELLAATKQFNGRGVVIADPPNWRVKGMKTSLKNYHVLDAGFMRQRENGVKGPRSGLMADQMGLGKTMMMLANIVNGRPPRSDPIKTTLIVATPCLLLQWDREIRANADCNFRIMRYGAGNRLDASHAHELLTSPGHNSHHIWGVDQILSEQQATCDLSDDRREYALVAQEVGERPWHSPPHPILADRSRRSSGNQELQGQDLPCLSGCHGDPQMGSQRHTDYLLQVPWCPSYRKLCNLQEQL